MAVSDIANDATRTLIDQLLEEERLLTAVGRFAQKHAGEDPLPRSRIYRDLIPLERPGAGEQYAFEVDLDRCSGCKACVAACHSLNGLEEDESWRSTGMLAGGESEALVQHTVTTACHHCVDPACMNGCPVLAYEKDAGTGIVRHLDDQCIGCQYCVLKCPYEVPRYSDRLGIVRKCDMCSSRLAAGEAPACAQSCPSAAIRITVVDQAVLRDQHSQAENSFLPASPDPSLTIPATRYLSRRGLTKELRAADEHHFAPAPPHWPLVWMLVLTQAGIGAAWVESGFYFAGEPIRNEMILVSTGLIIAGILASILHLGRPLRAWRAVIGVRRSWLSREIVAFGILAPSVLLHLAAGVLPELHDITGSVAPRLLVCLSGAAALVCSVMVYADTPREFWHWKRTAPAFLVTALLLGGALGSMLDPSNRMACAIATAAGLTRFGAMIRTFQRLSDEGLSPLKRSALLLAGRLRVPFGFRIGALIAGMVLLWIPASEGFARSMAAAAALLLLFASEIAGRWLFFRAVAQPKMPGGLP